MQSDIVDFQRQGWKPEEIMAGLCNVLPKNIWLYVSQIPNLSAIGTRFVLQGGTQYNLAAVKAQVDFIESRFKGKDVTPRTSSCTSTAARPARSARRSRPGACGTTAARPTFIGLERVRDITYSTTRNEDTRCYFCKNKCLRTFIDVTVDGSSMRRLPPGASRRCRSKPGAQRLIIATCEKGHGRRRQRHARHQEGLDSQEEGQPELRRDRRRGRLPQHRPAAWWPTRPPTLRSPGAAEGARRADDAARAAAHRHAARAQHVLAAPLFTGYFEALGVKAENIVFSDYTTEELYKEGAKRGAIDPCFPSKLGIPHVHNLLCTRVTPRSRSTSSSSR